MSRNERAVLCPQPGRADTRRDAAPSGAAIGRAAVALVAAAAITLTVGAGCTDTAAEQEALHQLVPADRAALSLAREAVPEPGNLDEFVKDRDAAIRLGKALFWDMAVGSDGRTACASCHFHAGADARTRNQLNPGTAGGNTSFTAQGPNHTLAAADFPFHRLADPDDSQSAVLADTRNVAGSQGVVKKRLIELFHPFLWFLGREIGQLQPDPIFHVGDRNVRQVTGRNSPSVINAVFNFRQFWDGRASPIFNGVSPFGVRDTGARVYRAAAGGALEAVAVAINNASLASQAVGPPPDAVEQSFAGRTWPMIGKKMLLRRALMRQRVSRDDSVLGELAHHSLPGLTQDYRTMIGEAFHDVWWAGAEQCVSSDDDGNASLVAAPASGCHDSPDLYSQAEANFSLFFGLAVQLYEATLISDEAPVDRYAAGDDDALTPTQKLGLEIFTDQGGCADCHMGPEFSDASVSAVERFSPIRAFVFPVGTAHIDTGFHNVGVRPNDEDVGVGGDDPFGLPLSLTHSSRQGLEVGFPLPPMGPDDFIAQHAGSVKTPILRNVELTGPYMRNGGQATLRQVVDFYNRGGDFLNTVVPIIQPLGLTEAEKEALVEFLRALTDPRVVAQSAPFDHPALQLFEGGGDRERAIELPAVGRDGGAPISTFLDLDPHQP